VRWNPHQLHLNSVLAQAPARLFTFTHQRVSLMCNFPRQHSLDRTQTINENKIPLRITSVMCRSGVNRALSSAVKTYQSPHNPQSKSHPFKKCTTHHTRTSQSIARGAPSMITSPPEHWQVSSPYAHLPNEPQGELAAHDA
jgi:hypothetical protein